MEHEEGIIDSSSTSSYSLSTIFTFALTVAFSIATAITAATVHTADTVIMCVLYTRHQPHSQTGRMYVHFLVVALKYTGGQVTVRHIFTVTVFFTGVVITGGGSVLSGSDDVRTQP